MSACQHCCQALFFYQGLLHDLRDFYTILRDFCAILHDFYTILCNFCDVFARHKLSAARHLKLFCTPVGVIVGVVVVVGVGVGVGLGLGVDNSVQVCERK